MSETEKRGRGRPRLHPQGTLDEEQVRVGLLPGTKERIGAALRPGESAQAFIRLAIDREIALRERRAPED